MKALQSNHKAMAFVLITVMINTIGFGIMIPVLPSLLKELTGLPNNEAAIHGGWLTFVFATMQFLCMPIMGALSDAYGRRRIMLISLFGLAIDYFIMGFAPTIAFLYFGRAIAGAFGSTFSIANAYIADISPPETRAQNFALVGAVFGVGFMLGPVIGGVLGEYGPRVPFLAAGVISLLNMIFGYFVLPETLKPEDRRPFTWKRASPWGALRALGRISGAKGLMFIVFLMALAHTVYPSTYSFSMMEGLGWSERDIGWSLGAFGVSSILVQGGLIRIVVPRTGLFWAGMIGIISAMIAYITLGVADKGWIVYAAGPFAALAGFYNPALNNMISSRIPTSEQGELQGAIGAAQGLALMIGPLIMTNVFNNFADRDAAHYIPGAPFFLASLLAILGIIIFVLVTDKDSRSLQIKSEDV